MRVFWACVALLAAIGVWFMLQPGDGEARSDPRSEPAKELVGSGADITAGAQPPAQAVSVPSTGSDTTSDTTSNTAPNTAPDAAADAASGPSEPPQSGAPRPEIDLLGESGTVIVPSATAPRTLRTDDRKPSDIVRRIDDRTLELDGRFRITGNGSDADPYLITWEMLTSASEYIDPAQNARTPPPWVRLLDGTSVKISGYYSTAVRVALAKNLLLTLNRWDGCCIGVPPTAFDAIDITMRDPLTMRGLHLTRFGTFKGLFRAECLDAAGFLIGLYRLEDATFETK